MLGTIDSMSVEIQNQIEDLPRYARYLSELSAAPDREKGGRKCVFTGAGDSFAAALAAEQLSEYAARCFDPYEISLRPSVVTDSHLYVVSVSGRTKSNIEAAKAAKKYAARVTAITANRDSALSKSSDDVLDLRFCSEGRLTPGTGSFTASLLACYSRIQSLPEISDLSHIYEEALLWSAETDVPINSTTFFVGTGLAYPLAIYGKAKIHEVLGSKAQSQTTEQFSHMELFSLTRDDLVIVMPEDEHDDLARELHSLLEEMPFRAVLFPTKNDDRIKDSLRGAIYLQTLAWNTAKDHGVRECAFVDKKHLLAISDKMIYIP